MEADATMGFSQTSWTMCFPIGPDQASGPDVEFLLASQNVFLPRKQARDTKILISPDGAREKAHLDAGDTPLADTPHPARVE